MNPECTRSKVGHTRFDARVASWYERLFSEVPRMSQEDERFSKIAGQRFVLIDPERLSMGSQGWVDPRDHKTTSRIVVPASLERHKPEVEAPAVAPPRNPEPMPAAAQAHSSAERESLLGLNTPVQQGRMLAGAPVRAPAERWAPVQGPPEKIVKSGAKIKLGG